VKRSHETDDRCLKVSAFFIPPSRKGLLEESETIALAKKINSQLSTVRLRQKIQEFSIESGERTGRIDQHQFVLLFKDLATRPEVFFLMVRYSGKDYFAKDDLHFFLEGEQVTDFKPLGTEIHDCLAGWLAS
jgi:hypothetical protein